MMEDASLRAGSLATHSLAVYPLDRCSSASMDATLQKTARIERTCAGAAALERAIEQWLAGLRAADTDAEGRYVGRHRTQVEALESMLTAAAGALRAGAGALLSGPGASCEVGALYDSCRDYDEAAVWLERLWGFFRDKLDQRNDPVVGCLLKGADEIVWSCYHEVMDGAQRRRRRPVHGPAPLPFLAPEYSPAAIESDRPLPPGLTLSVAPPGWDQEIDDLVRALPMGLLRLPPWCVTAPWWLVYIAHEVGHHVAADLSLHEHVRDSIVAAVTALEPAEASRWKAWADELFADFFSVLMVGPWAAWSVLEVERSTPANMLQPRRAYPAPLVRVAFLAAAARALEVEGEAVPAGFEVTSLTEAYPTLRAHLMAIDAVIAALRKDLPNGLGRLEELCRFDAREFKQSVKFWQARLQRRDLPSTVPTIHTGRHVAAAAVAAYADVVKLADPEKRVKEACGLAEITVKALQASAMPGTRGGELPAGALPGQGAALAARLIAWSRQRRQSTGQGGV
jgi:hypothetical protein